MKTTITILALLAATPAAAEDRYSGYLSGDCNGLACRLLIEPAGADTWTVEWEASDPTDPENRPLCAFKTTAELGGAVVGDVNVHNIAVGRVRGKPFGLFDTDDGRISWSSSWEACPGVRPKAIYSELGD